MNSNKKSLLSQLLAIGGGFLGLALYQWLLGTRDAEGLLAANHPALWLLSLLTVGVVAALFVLTRKLPDTKKYYSVFPKSVTAGVFTFASALFLFLTLLGELIERPDGLTQFCDFFGLLAVFSLGFLGYCRMARKRPNFLFHTVLCLFFMLRLVCRYRAWSGNPQPAAYAWELLALVFLMLAAYHRAAFDLNTEKRRTVEFTTLCGLFFALTCTLGTGSAFYTAAALWLLPYFPVPKA